MWLTAPVCARRAVKSSAMESVLADALIGRMLDRRYHVRSRIAHGGMATVYLATDTRLDRQVALKVMHAELARDADFVARFIGEAKSVARLSHPNIVQVFDQGSDGQFLYLAMEYVPGRTLRSLLRERGWLTWGEALEVMDPMLAGLAAAHRAGIVHRDVKPENVLLTADGRVKVVDFGLARAQAAAGNTRTGLIIGTVAYIAPEQVTGGITDVRTDVYAAGVMLFELLTGRQPYTGDSPLAVAYKHVNEEVPPVSALAGGIPPAVDQLVRAATSRDPRQRPADAAVFLRAVRSLRGMPAGDESEAITGAWADPGQAYGAPGGYPAAAGGAGGSHTMVVAAGNGYDPAGYGPGAGYPGGPAYDGGAAHGGEVTFGGREPFLQRWLFSRRLAYLAAGAAAVLGLAFGGWWLTSGRYTTLPQVDGMTVTAATRVLHQAGFDTRAGAPVLDNAVPKGDVISTSPSGRAVKGATIVLTVSAGPRMITVPPVTGQSLAGAIALLRRAGLTVSGTPKNVAEDGTPIGTVAGTTPAAGTSWPATRPVYVDVVAGMALPDLVGQNIGAIQSWAGSNNIQLNVVQVASNQPQGIIVSQSPAPGSPVAPGQTPVTVDVSNGPPQVQIPGNLRGQKFQQVQQELQQLGFQVNGQQIGPGNTVFMVSPTGSAPSGSTITVYYGGF
jgi:eukaryotic-like serine/threonine-protein kinase